MTSFPFIIGMNTVTVCIPGKPPQVISSTNSIFSSIVKALKDKNYASVARMLDPEQIKQFAKSVDETVSLGDSGPKPSGKLAELIKEHYKQGYPRDYLVNFFNKLQKNPSYRVVNQLFDFIEASMESGGFTITEEGNIVAYKKVRPDFKDIHSGKFDNSPGQTVMMPRNEVDEDPEVTCSNGLHFAAFSYLEHYTQAENYKIVIVEVDPADVVAIPKDYSNAKARCCKYKVIGEFTGSYKEKDEYVKQPAVVNNTRPPEQQVKSADSFQDDFANLVKKVLGEVAAELNDISERDNCTCCDGCETAMSSRILDGTFSKSKLRTMTIAEMVKLHSDTANYHALNISTPTKFRDKESAVERCLRLQKYVRENC